MDKFGRSYELTIGTSLLDRIIVELPFTIEFDIQRNILSSCNVASIRVYNLSEKNRNKIFHDFNDYDDLNKTMELKAGYGDSLPVVCSGNINSAWSVREGTNFITQIEAYDGLNAMNNAYTDTALSSGMTQKVAVELLVSSLESEGVKRGKISNFSGIIPRGNSISGTTINLLKEYTNDGVFIDKGLCHCLLDEDCFLGDIYEIDSSSGLLGTPVRNERLLTFDMVFEPRLSIGQIIKLNSNTGKNFNGLYKVVSLKHRGMISENVCGDAITSVGLFYGAKELNLVI